MSTKHVRFVARNLIDAPSFSMVPYSMAASFPSHGHKLHGHKQLRKPTFSTFVQRVPKTPQPVALMSGNQQRSLNKSDMSSLDNHESTQESSDSSKVNTTAIDNSARRNSDIPHPNLDKELPPTPREQSPSENDRGACNEPSRKQSCQRFSISTPSDLSSDRPSVTGDILIVYNVQPEDFFGDSPQPGLEVNDESAVQLEARAYDPNTLDESQALAQPAAAPELHKLPEKNFIEEDSSPLPERCPSVIQPDGLHKSSMVSSVQLDESVIQPGPESREIPIIPQRVKVIEHQGQSPSQKKAMAVMGIDKNTLRDDSKRKQQRFHLKVLHHLRNHRQARPYSTTSIMRHQHSRTPTHPNEVMLENYSEPSPSHLALNDLVEDPKDLDVSVNFPEPLLVPSGREIQDKGRNKLQKQHPNDADPWMIPFSTKDIDTPSSVPLHAAPTVPRRANSPTIPPFPIPPATNPLVATVQKVTAEWDERAKEALHRREQRHGERRREKLKTEITVLRDVHGPNY